MRKSFKNILLRLLREREVDEDPEVGDNQDGTLGQAIVFNLLAIVLVIFVLYTMQSILLPILFAILLAVTLFPIGKRLERIGFNRALASLTALVVGIILFSALSYLLVSQTINIGKDASAIVGKIEKVLIQGEDWVAETFGLSRTELLKKGREELNKAIPTIGGFVSGFFGSVGSFLSLGILVPLLIFFFLYYRDFFKEFVLRAFHRAPRARVSETWSKMYDVLQSYLGGMVIVMSIIAALNTIGLWVLGIEYAWFFGVLASILMLLPYIGIAIGSLFPALFALATKDSYWYAIGVIAWFQIVQAFEGNLITPNIVGGKISLNPLVSILSIFLFSMLFGFAGLILALPLTAIIKVIFDAVPQLRPYGFLLSEPRKRYLRTARQQRRRSRIEAEPPTATAAEPKPNEDKQEDASP